VTRTAPCVALIDSLFAAAIGQGQVEARVVYGSRAHVPDAMVMTDGTVYRFITDHLGSVRLVVNAATGGSNSP
jgi:hypothetical protein